MATAVPRTVLPRIDPLAATWPRRRTCVSGDLPLVVTNVAAAMTALGDPTRQAIFERLVDGPRPVGELAEELPVTRPAVSQHLKVLKDAGLVTDRQVGTRRLYQADPQALADLRAYFDSFWDQSLAAFRDAAATQPGEPDA